ncbi:DUF349 domain-containing protein [Anditalea andensis]|uniref:DUF349 domain-containing protein n=1 Tax=Anditalea andensis TaxID=1048983 RepID=A0A074L3G1_9BACT|nr:DUF349 domain-containing protein [Anditalea andensis]KEO74398.1 hypothetical protein EL17_06585 [Anditalea andensis]
MEHPYGYIKEDKVYLKGFLNQGDRIIGEVKEDEASTIKYFEERFKMVEEKVATLKKDIEENQNKGSFLMKLIHLRDALMQYDALGDFVPLIEELNHLETYLEEIIQSNRERNLEIKKGLILEADALKNDTDWKNTTEAYKNLKLRWIKTGPVEKQIEMEIENQFNEAVEHFFQKRKDYYDGLALQAEENIKVYESLVQQARDAHDLHDVKQAFEISKKIQKQWKESGRVPAEKRQPLWDEFSKLNNRIFSKFKRVAQQAAFLPPRELIKKTEQMANEMKRLAKSEPTSEVFAAAKKLQADWKQLPPKKPRDAQQFSKTFVFFSDVVFEKSFLQRLVKSKNSDYDKMNVTEQKQAKIHLMRDLIHRDQKELETIQNNAENFRAPEGSFDMILQRKIGGYKRKLDVKNYILKEL